MTKKTKAEKLAMLDSPSFMADSKCITEAVYALALHHGWDVAADVLEAAHFAAVRVFKTDSPVAENN